MPIREITVNHQLESRMRETRLSGSEGGEAFGPSLPLSKRNFRRDDLDLTKIPKSPSLLLFLLGVSAFNRFRLT
jgi:hypothetical protein